MNYAIIDNNGDIYRVFASLNLAQLFYEYQEYEEPSGYKIELTKEPLTVFPEGNYYAKWNQ